jgi:cobalamin synthase
MPTTAPYDAPVLLFLILGFTPWILLLTLAAALYLTVIELRELELHYTWWIWWLLLVFDALIPSCAHALYRNATAGPQRRADRDVRDSRWFRGAVLLVALLFAAVVARGCGRWTERLE